MCNMFDCHSGTCMYFSKLTNDNVFVTCPQDSTGAILGIIVRKGPVFRLQVNEQNLVPYILNTLRNTRLASNMAERLQLAGIDRRPQPPQTAAYSSSSPSINTDQGKPRAEIEKWHNGPRLIQADPRNPFSLLSEKDDPQLPITSSPPRGTPTHPQQQRTNAVPSSNLSFRNDRTKIQQVLGNYEAEPVELSSEYFEYVLTGHVALGAGSFGVVVMVKDVVLKKQFAVKTTRLGLDKDQRDFVRRTFRQELQFLQRFRHPNIVRMYGYYPDVGTHYLLYEFAVQGSLESMLKTEDGRKILTFPRRLRILHGVAQGLNFLHTGIQLDPNQVSMEKYTAFHRDVKSANICLTSTFGAKLIDCGLGKLVAKDSKILESIARSAQFSSGGGGGGPLGTPAYRDPGYEHMDYEYGSYCDVFSFGVVMAEVFTGTLSGIAAATGSLDGCTADSRTIHRKYVHASRKQRSLRMDVDDLISDASEDSLNELSSMSLQCMDEEPEDRPNALEIMSSLHGMIVKDQCEMTWTRPDSSSVPGGVGVPAGQQCCISSRQTTFGLSSSDGPFISADLLQTHSGIARGQDPLECMLDGCTKCYREDDVQRCLPAAMYKEYVRCQVLGGDYMRTFAKVYAAEVSNRLETKIDVALNVLKCLRKNSDRALVVLASLSTGERTPCSKFIKSTGTKGTKDLSKDAFFQETAVYFCVRIPSRKAMKNPS